MKVELIFWLQGVVGVFARDWRKVTTIWRYGRSKALLMMVGEMEFGWLAGDELEALDAGRWPGW